MDARSSRGRASALLALAAVAAPAPAARAHDAHMPPGFTDEVVLETVGTPTVVAFAPDGRVFVAEKRGVVLVYDGLGDPTPEVAVDVSARVQDYWDRGLLGMALDPAFPAEPYVYLLYTLDAPAGETAPYWNDTCPTPPGPTTDGCVVDAALT
ncbi:MAG: PQQ-dependent sugar dehydrogenase, partial [Planctomycetes bacterium]|nr:PQQ-dependent sugar dehydrogenase [Planctomycetota bacterium]